MTPDLVKLKDNTLKVQSIFLITHTTADCLILVFSTREQDLRVVAT